MNIETKLKENLGDENVYINEPMSKHTSFKIGGNAEYFIKIQNIDSLRYVLKFSKENDLPVFILGNGSNILVSDKGIKGLVCQIQIDKFEVKEKEEDMLVTMGAGCKNAFIAQKLANLEIEGFEFASGIPRKHRWSN
ncbi:MAG: FAD-binding protein [Clostridia bacterium]|nr:FAD-binding protein [Clostridia bacterium]MCI9275427.1 FAD-binding protein [Clostridia bacterium]